MNLFDASVHCAVLLNMNYVYESLRKIYEQPPDSARRRQKIRNSWSVVTQKAPIDFIECWTPTMRRGPADCNKTLVVTFTAVDNARRFCLVIS